MVLNKAQLFTPSSCGDFNNNNINKNNNIKVSSRFVLSFYNLTGLVLLGDDDTALECFESLIHLAKEQLNHVCAEQSKLPPLTAEERTELCHKVGSVLVKYCEMM